tara:strand:+ start:1236 stop:1937 length:702 start_codon:yes stop_codon:yes gene_type:complete
MLFFTKKTKIVLDAFTSNTSAYKDTPIVEAYKKIPSWITNMKGTYTEQGFIPRATMKLCPAIQDYNMRGIIIPLWSDLAIKIENKSIQWQFADCETSIVSHPSLEWDAFNNSLDNVHLKLGSPWLLYHKDKVFSTWDKPYFHKELSKEIDIVSGINEYKTQSTTNINLFINIQENKVIQLLKGTPMVKITPLSDKEFIVKTHLIDKTEWDKKSMQNNRTSFIKNKIKKCPFKR